MSTFAVGVAECVRIPTDKQTAGVVIVVVVVVVVVSREGSRRLVSRFVVAVVMLFIIPVVLSSFPIPWQSIVPRCVSSDTAEDFLEYYRHLQRGGRFKQGQARWQLRRRPIIHIPRHL